MGRLLSSVSRVAVPEATSTASAAASTRRESPSSSRTLAPACATCASNTARTCGEAMGARNRGAPSPA